MKLKTLIFVLFSCTFSIAAFAQKHTRDFTIALPEKKVQGSLYNNLSVIDQREDTTLLGVVQLGAFNKKAKVIPEIPLREQLVRSMTLLIDGDAANGELILLIRQFSLAEVTLAMSEKGYFQLRASMFAKSADQWKELTRVDTVVLVRSLDVTKALIRECGEFLNAFIASNLTKTVTEGRSYSLAEINSLDSIEKLGLALYYGEKYQDGAYTTFNSFASQQPDNKDIKIEFWKSGNPKSVQLKNAKGKFEETELNRWYAFVYEGKMFINTEFGLYPLVKRNNDFYFTGKTRVSAKTGELVAAQLFFGIIGGLIASSAGTTDVYEMKIDHVSGGFIKAK